MAMWAIVCRIAQQLPRWGEQLEFFLQRVDFPRWLEWELWPDEEPDRERLAAYVPPVGRHDHPALVRLDEYAAVCPHRPREVPPRTFRMDDPLLPHRVQTVANWDEGRFRHQQNWWRRLWKI